MRIPGRGEPNPPLARFRPAPVNLAGITRHPTDAWMIQMVRNAVDETSGGLSRCRYVLHDRDAKYCNKTTDWHRAAKVVSESPPQ